MNDNQIKAHIVEYAQQIDRLETLFAGIDKNMERLAAMYDEALSMYNDTADRIEALAKEIQDRDKMQGALTLVYNLRKRTVETKS